MPYRVVDRFYQGWYLRSGDGRFDADGGRRRGLETLDFTMLELTRGPLRRAAGPLLVALYRLVLDDARAGREGGARYRVMAGREGSWESEAMVRLAWNVGADLAEKKTRFDEAAVTELVRVVQGWVMGPDVYVEVAANLAWLFSKVADETGGWPAVADRRLCSPGSASVGTPSMSSRRCSTTCCHRRRPGRPEQLDGGRMDRTG